MSCVFREWLNAQSSDRSGRADGKHTLLARQRLLQLCLQRLGSAGQAFWWWATRWATAWPLFVFFISMIINPGSPRLIVLLNAVFSMHFRCLRFLLFNNVLGYRFYWQVHNPQNALAWYLLSGAWEGSQRCGQALYTTLELHQSEIFTTTLPRPWPAHFKFIYV